MFQGTAVEYINASESDGTPIEKVNDGIVIARLVRFYLFILFIMYSQRDKSLFIFFWVRYCLLLRNPKTYSCHSTDPWLEL